MEGLLETNKQAQRKPHEMIALSSSSLLLDAELEGDAESLLSQGNIPILKLQGLPL